jgi:hypothetical protein
METEVKELSEEMEDSNTIINESVSLIDEKKPKQAIVKLKQAETNLKVSKF